MLGLVSRYKKDINRAFFQVTPVNILGEYISFWINLNEEGVTSSEMFGFMISSDSNELLVPKVMSVESYQLGTTSIRYVKGESPKILVGFREVKVQGFSKYKFITLDVQAVKEYFDANYGKKSLTEIETHLNSVKDVLVRTSFFLIDSMPKSIVINKLELPKTFTEKKPQANVFDENRLLDLIAYGVREKTPQPFVALADSQVYLSTNYDFYNTLAALRSLSVSFGTVDISIKVAGVDKYMPYLSIDINRLLNQEIEFARLESINDFWGDIVDQYERTTKSAWIPMPSYLGNGMHNLNGSDQIITGNELSNIEGGIVIGTFKGKEENFTAYWDTTQLNLTNSYYNVKKSEVKKLVKILKTKRNVTPKLKFDKNDFNVTQLEKHFLESNKPAVRNKEEAFKEALSLINKEKVESISRKNPKFKEVFDSAISEIYTTYINSKEPIKESKSETFYFQTVQGGNVKIYCTRASSYTTNLQLNRVLSESDIYAIQASLDEEKAEFFKDIARWNSPFYLYMSRRIVFNDEPYVDSLSSFFDLRYDTEDFYLSDIYIKASDLYEETQQAQKFRLSEYFYDNVVEFSLKLCITLNVIQVCFLGKKTDMFEYHQKQVAFLISRGLVLSKSKLLDLESEIQKTNIQSVSLQYSRADFYRYRPNEIRDIPEEHINTFLSYMIEVACNNNEDLNEYFNPTVQAVSVEPLLEEPTVQEIEEESPVIKTDEEDDFSDIFAEAEEVNKKLAELQKQVAEQETLIDNLDL